MARHASYPDLSTFPPHALQVLAREQSHSERAVGKQPHTLFKAALHETLLRRAARQTVGVLQGDDPRRTRTREPRGLGAAHDSKRRLVAEAHVLHLASICGEG